MGRAFSWHGVLVRRVSRQVLLRTDGGSADPLRSPQKVSQNCLKEVAYFHWRLSFCFTVPRALSAVLVDSPPPDHCPLQLPQNSGPSWSSSWGLACHPSLYHTVLPPQCTCLHPQLVFWGFSKQSGSLQESCLLDFLLFPQELYSLHPSWVLAKYFLFLPANK